uniref:Uncharacterized protein n=1 Tax=Oryza brachyantha TaxID=4533 RepID=J3N8G3_ORYBR
MSLELDVADRIMAIEVASEKRLARKNKELDKINSWLMCSLVIIVFLLVKIVDLLSQRY